MGQITNHSLSRMVSDTMSSLFPDRPIRPLPKRRLRERLPPELADSIKCPPSPKHDPGPLFYPPYVLKSEPYLSVGGIPATMEAIRAFDYGDANGFITAGGGQNAARNAVMACSMPDILSRSPRFAMRPPEADRAGASSQAPLSTASSIDGQDSFESNNKKKRKVPMHVDTSLGTYYSDAEMISIPIMASISSPGASMPGEISYSMSSHYATTTFSSSGMSGPGRGRYGRARNARSPLGDLPGGSNNWAVRSSKSRSGQWTHPTGNKAGPGIISNAIANANAEKHRQGQENIRTSHQPTTMPNPAASSQFTFTCDSQVPSTMSWPGLGHDQSSALGMPFPPGYGAPPAPQNGGRDAASRTAVGLSDTLNATAAPDGSGSPAVSAEQAKKERRKEAAECARAARLRRQQAQMNPPKSGEEWICEFCEYERIFGVPPRALIREYERKDLRRRRQEEERRRLLEKAKNKSRKARKAMGNAANVPQASTKTSNESATGQGQLPNPNDANQSPPGDWPQEDGDLLDEDPLEENDRSGDETQSDGHTQSDKLPPDPPEQPLGKKAPFDKVPVRKSPG